MRTVLPRLRAQMLFSYAWLSCACTLLWGRLGDFIDLLGNLTS